MHASPSRTETLPFIAGFATSYIISSLILFFVLTYTHVLTSPWALLHASLLSGSIVAIGAGLRRVLA